MLIIFVFLDKSGYNLEMEDNKWSQQFNIDYPQCKMCGMCCRCASPSLPYEEIKKLAKEGESFARDFADIFVPYESVEEAKKVSPDIVKRSFEVASKKGSKVKPEEVIFFHCKYLSDDNKCLIYEDRPKLCRDYPDMPFLVFSENCAYNNWGEVCKQRYKVLLEELENIKQVQKEMAILKEQRINMPPHVFLMKFEHLEKKYMKAINNLEKHHVMIPDENV